jgi:multidrug resistance efflux pump
MSSKSIVALIAVAVAAVAALLYWRHDRGPAHYTGFVEGEERIVRAEVTGRVLEVRFGEGAPVEANAVIALLDDRDVAARIASKGEALSVLEHEIRAQEERITMTEATAGRDVAAQRAQLREAESQAGWAEKNFAREQELVKSGASTAQLLDDARTRRDQARSQVDRARELFARAEASLGNVAIARHDLETLHKRRDQAAAELAELEVQHGKFQIRAPGIPTVVQTQYLWPGEFAQPGTAVLSMIDPRDKYVQIYVPVAELENFRVGQRVTIELDSRPGRRVPGEVSFIADRASFTPEKIETRSDRMGQVYRAKIRILEDVESFQPGTEGNVYVG